MHGRMPAEVGNVKPERKTRVQQVQAFGDFVWLVIYIDRRHGLPPGASLSPDMFVKILAEVLECPFQGHHRSRRQRAKRVAHAQQPGMLLKDLDVARHAAPMLDGTKEISDPRQALPARRPPPAGLAGGKFLT